MSYASDVKKELTTLEVHFGNAKAELMALIRMNGSLSIVDHQFVFVFHKQKTAYEIYYAGQGLLTVTVRK